MVEKDISYPILIGDIGGTNARLALVDDPADAPRNLPHLKTAQFETIEQAINAALEDATARPATALLAAAGPITPKGLDLTNCHWVIEPDRFLAETGIGELVLFNDFDAQAFALAILDQSDLTQLNVGADGEGQSKLLTPPTPRTKAVIGPGTGLGVGTLVRGSSCWIPVGGEGGHVDLGPRTEREEAIWPHLTPWPGDSGKRISAESILCGRGLVSLYRAICAADNQPPKFSQAPEITDAASQGKDVQAVESVELFCKSLGRVAGDLALTVMAKGGIYIGGGIPSYIEPFLKQGIFRKSFVDKAPHQTLMEQIPTYLIKHPAPALAGLAGFARDPHAFDVALDHRKWPRQCDGQS